MKKILKKIIPNSVKKWFHLTQAFIASARFGFPGKKMVLIGVTGTSGKSTTAAMIFHLLQENGIDAGLISTVGAKAGKKNVDTGFHVTTPDPADLQKLLRFMLKRGIAHVVVECSSHALAQGRLGFLKFDYSVFTNITRDHLDWHKTWEHYASSKAILAENTKENGKIIVNRRDKDMYNFLSKKLGESFQEKSIAFSFNEILNIEEDKEGLFFRLNDQNYTIPIYGLYNVENALAAINVALLLGLKPAQIASAFKEFPGITGRMQVMKREPFFVIVDFAHNTDSLIQSLTTARKLANKDGNLITVFGSAGLRDIEKRFSMGEAAAAHSDITIITAEDPRTESLYEINTQILQGAEAGGGALVVRFPDHKSFEEYISEERTPEKGSVFIFDEETTQGRYDAVEFATRIANDGDVVITEGKGHEKSLCFGEREYEFTDQEAVKRALEEASE